MKRAVPLLLIVGVGGLALTLALSRKASAGPAELPPQSTTVLVTNVPGFGDIEVVLHGGTAYAPTELPQEIRQRAIALALTAAGNQVSTIAWPPGLSSDYG